MESTAADRAWWCLDAPYAPCIQSTTEAAQYVRSYHPGGANLTLADGSVRFVSENVDAEVFKAHGSRAGGEITTSL